MHDDVAYFRQRAIEERERSGTAASPSIAEIHLSLAMKYEAMAEQAESALPRDRSGDSVQVSSEGAAPQEMR